MGASLFYELRVTTPSRSVAAMAKSNREPRMQELGSQPARTSRQFNGRKDRSGDQETHGPQSPGSRPHGAFSADKAFITSVFSRARLRRRRSRRDLSSSRVGRNGDVCIDRELEAATEAEDAKTGQQLSYSLSGTSTNTNKRS
jgi:hypothetical protein